MQAYLKAWSKVGYVLPILLLITAAGERGLQVGQNFFLSIWTDATTAKTLAHEDLDNRIYIAAYFLLGAFPVAIQVSQAFACASFSELLRSSETAVGLFPHWTLQTKACKWWNVRDKSIRLIKLWGHEQAELSSKLLTTSIFFVHFYYVRSSVQALPDVMLPSCKKGKVAF